MKALIAAACLLGWGVAGLTDQTAVRPNLTGTWTVIADRSAPPGSAAALGDSITIQQTDSAVTITRASPVTAKGPDGRARDLPQSINRSTTNTYIFDGVEREVAVPPGYGRSGSLTQGSPDLSSTYRAVWTTDQLVIMTFGRATPALSARTREHIGQLKQIDRTSFALDPSGVLVVDRVTVVDPTAGGPVEDAPVALRSFYRKDGLKTRLIPADAHIVATPVSRPRQSSQMNRGQGITP